MKCLLKVMCSIALCIVFSSCGSSKKAHDKDAIGRSVVKEMRFLNPKVGPQATCKRLSKEKLQDEFVKATPLPLFVIETSGFCPGEQYSLFRVNMDLEQSYIYDLVANSDGQLQFLKSNGASVCELFPLCGFINGEMVSFAYVSKTTPECIVASVAPDPIEYVWEDKAYMCLWLLTKDACNFTLAGKGFQPNEMLLLTSESGDEKLQNDLSADSDGILVSVVSPGIINKTGGTAKLTIQRKLTGATGTLEYLWGTDAKAKAKEPLKKEGNKI